MKKHHKIIVFVFIAFMIAIIIAGCDLFRQNSPPEITSTPTTQVNENSPYEYNLQSYDADGDSVNYYLDVKPDWLSISGKRISGTTPEVPYDKNYAIKIMASDGEDFSEQDYSIKVKNVPDPENNPPEITSTPVTQTNENSYYEYNLQAEDEDEDDELTYSLANSPSWLSISGNKICGTTPEVYQDSSVSVEARVSDGKDSDSQNYNLLIKNVPAPAVSQTASLSGDIDIEYSAHLKDLTSANREVFHNENAVDSLSKEITNKNYSETLEGNKKGAWKFILSADGATPDEKTVEVPNYNPTTDVSGLEGMLDFEQGETIVLPLPTPSDKNPEDNPVKYSSVESLDNKISSRIKGDSLYVTSKRGAIGPYSIKLNFGNEDNGEGETTIRGTVEKPTIEWFNPFKRPVKGLAYYGSGDSNQDGFIDSLDSEAISNGTQVDEADVNGSGIVDYEDGQLLESYLAGDIPYLPGDYDKLQTKAERDDWVDKMIAIDPTSEMPPNNVPNDTLRWISGNYATQTCINFFGYNDEVPWAKYDLNDNRRFNLPVYFVGSTLYDSQGNPYMGHGINTILTGDNALEFNDWNFIEPQNDNTQIVPGETSSITIPGKIRIYSPNEFSSDISNLDMLKGEEAITFNIDNEGNVTYLNCPSCNPPTPHPDLVTERP
jgi:hypothetical protein